MTTSEARDIRYYTVIAYKMRRDLADYEAIFVQAMNAGDAARECHANGWHVVAVLRPDSESVSGIRCPVKFSTKHDETTPPALAVSAGWRERMEEAIGKLEEDYADYARSLSDKCYEKVERQREAIGTLMDELVELPPPMENVKLVTWSEADRRWNLATNFLQTKNGLFLMAAALISAGREGAK